MLLRHGLVLLGVLFLGACASAPRPSQLTMLNELTNLMTGSFSSQKQSERDDQFYDIRLEMVRIWPQRTDAVWFYVEQASAQALEEPYRQRVYKVTYADSRYTSTVYELPEPTTFIGAWRDPAPVFKGFSPDSLRLRSGCAVVMKRDSMHEYVGSTIKDHCESSLRGASYATSEVHIDRDGMISWDRGFNANGDQVWGPVLGPYQFDRREAVH